MVSVGYAVVTLLLLIPGFNPSQSREWTAGKGGYSIKGEAIAYNETTVILKRDRSEKLVAVEINELSAADQKFIDDKREQDKQKAVEPSTGDWHTWTSASGWQIRGRVLAYGRKDVTIDRKSGVVTVNGKAFSSLDALHQKLILAVLSKLENKTIEDEQALRSFASSLKGQPKQYSLEGVMLQLESGDQIPVPFFMFSDQDLKFLKSGWEVWLAADEDEQARQREDFLVRQEAVQYQAMQQRQMQHQQMEVLKLNLLAAATGVTSIWEVALFPSPGTWGRPTTVVVSARDSRTAAQLAAQQYPGFAVGPIRRVSNN